MKKLRLDKYLADMQAGTRSQVKQMIRKGRVAVNGAAVRMPEQKVDTEQDVVTLDGEPVGYTRMEYWMLNKPQGVVSATEDRTQQTVLSLLPDTARKDLFPVGRLDKDTEGLLLITNDGALAHGLLSPRRHVDKRYLAVVTGKPGAREQELFAEGLDIGDEKKTLPAKLELKGTPLPEAETAGKHMSAGAQIPAGERKLDGAQIPAGEQKLDGVHIPAGGSVVEITIQEGRYHQVKRMFEAVGMRVEYLKRLSMGPLVLDTALEPGQARRLTEEELFALRELYE